MHSNPEYSAFFTRATGGKLPHGWQLQLANEGAFRNRLIRIPTGFGKTLGVVLAWLWNAVDRGDGDWPRRLVLCLPMRVLVEQTEQEVRDALSALGLLRDPQEPDGKVGVYVLMGGIDAGEWYLWPERFSILICTQDMGISAALNRAYAAPRARWPAEFGLLSQDTLWVMDEVQLMDVGLATSAQLQAFRDDDRAAGRALRPCFTWWMSATLQPDWLAKSPDTHALCAQLPISSIPPDERHGRLWEDVSKPCRMTAVDTAKALAELAANAHADRGHGEHGPTLIVVNRVKLAVDVHEALGKLKSMQGVDLRLVHSRFRPHERKAWRNRFLNRDACAPGTNRIIVATQVIEAGVDLSAALLITELAPWASLVQRFGRAARWGGVAHIIVADFDHADDKKAAPYTIQALDAARDALRHLADVAPLQLETFEEQHPELRPSLYPYQPRQLLLRHELDELFDTTPDLSGADIDISRFIRSGDERDVQVFWAEVAEDMQPDATIRPAREALCAVPFLAARDWLCEKNNQSKQWTRLKDGKRAWVWDWLDGAWKRADGQAIFPGRTILVATKCGGYDEYAGWKPSSGKAVMPVVAQITSPQQCAADQADDREDGEELSYSRWQTIATHNRQVGQLARAIATQLAPRLADLFDLAGRWHDAGKAHEAFFNCIKKPPEGPADRPARDDLAKAPREAWLPLHKLYPMANAGRRSGFRHELASTLALFALLQRQQPDHPALLGPWRELLAAMGTAPMTNIASTPPNALEQEVLALDADQFNLLAYLVCSHHGKVRMAWHVGPADQQSTNGALRIRGIESGDTLPAVTLAAADGSLHLLPQSRLDLSPAAAGLSARTGASWTERVLGLLDQHGPFALAWCEALLIAADRRASRAPLADPLLENDNVHHALETGHSTLAQPAGSGETPHPLAAHSAQRGDQHGVRGRTGEPGDAGSGTRTPAHATRHLQTRHGILSYTELAPFLARQAQALEQAIEAGEFDAQVLDDALIENLHLRICAELTPQLAGWRHDDVTVGTHTPPPHYQVPMLVREYTRDLQARLANLPAETDHHLLEALAFAEGRLLSIHPFADFNGRATRVFLRLLLRRLDLPWVELSPVAGAQDVYLAALRAADGNHWQPLAEVWRQRFEQEVGP